MTGGGTWKPPTWNKERCIHSESRAVLEEVETERVRDSVSDPFGNVSQVMKLDASPAGWLLLH